MEFDSLALAVAVAEYRNHPRMVGVLAAIKRSPHAAPRLAARFVPYDAGKPGRVEKISALLEFFARDYEQERLLSPSFWVDAPAPRKPRGDANRDEAARMVIRLGLGLCLTCEQNVDTVPTDGTGRAIAAFYCSEHEDTADESRRRRDRARMSRLIEGTDTRRCVALLAAA